MSGIRYRVTRALVGTLSVIIGMLMVVVIPDWLMALPRGWSLTILMLKMLLGVGFVAKAMDLYEKASFPPGEQALQDPISVWIQTHLANLKLRAWPLWFLAYLILMFTPIMTAVFLPLVLLRPFHAAFVSPEPKGEVLTLELRRTGRFLFAMGKGIVTLSLCSMMALSSALIIFAGAIYQMHLRGAL
jgi:hypothetical protein